MKKLITLLLIWPSMLHAQADVNAWIMNLNGQKASYWSNTASPGSPPNFVFNISPDSADVLKMCYTSDSIWVRCQGLTENMGQYLNPGDCLAQNYVFRFPRNPVVATTKVVSPKTGAIGALLNGVPIYGLSNSYSWNGTANVPGAGGLGIWNTEVGLSEGFVLDTAFGAHPQQNGAYHSHTTPYRFYRYAAAGKHSPVVGFAFDGYPVYGPYGYVTATDSTSGVMRMKSGYSLRSITTRTTLPYGVALTPAQYGPDVSTTYPIGYYCEDYEWLVTNGGDLDEYNGRFCVTPEYPAGTYAYFVTVDATGAAVFPYYIGIDYYGAPDQGNFGLVSTINMPTGLSDCMLPATSSVNNINAAETNFSIYPNPSTGHITVANVAGKYTNAVIYNELGSIIYSGTLDKNIEEIELNAGAGIYFIKFYNKDSGAVATKNFILVK